LSGLNGNLVNMGSDQVNIMDLLSKIRGQNYLLLCIYNKYMEIEFDQAKSEKNRLERNLPLDLVVTFE
jgi:hypothetical protein